jgi:hypothetical protein
MLDISDRVRTNSVDSSLIHIEDCPCLPIAPIVAKVIANNREEREYLGILRWRLIVGRAADDGPGFTGFVFSRSRVRMRSNEIVSVFGSVFGPIVSFWRATIRAYRRCTLCGAPVKFMRIMIVRPVKRVFSGNANCTVASVEH